jgi:hypothetical protein
MGVAYNTFIAKSEYLGLMLDATNTKSYPGSGTTWTDLSIRKCNGTMFGTVPFATDVVPCFDFATVTGASASAASLGFTFPFNPVTLTGGFTFSAWVKNAPATVGQQGLFSNTGSATGFRFGIGLNGCYVLMAGADGSGYDEPVLGFTSTLSASLWYNVAMVFDRGGVNNSGTPQWQLYLNGVYQTGTNMVTPQTVAMTTAAPGLVRSACCGLYTGKLAQFMVHNTPLNAEDIVENFNAYRGRFGV